MRRRACFAAIALLTLWIAGCQGIQPSVENTEALDDLLIVQAVDPLEKVFRETAVFSPREAVADVARGEHATFQFAIRSARPIKGLRAVAGPVTSEIGALPTPEVGFVGYVKVGRSTPRPSRDRLLPPSGYYPDPILKAPALDVAANLTQPVWLRLAIPKDATPGTYQGTLTLTGQLGERDFEMVQPFTVHVYPPVIDTTSLWVTNWYSLGQDKLALLNDGESVEPYSQTYWELVRVLARTMADYRQNVALISPLRLAHYTVDDGQYVIDFSHFDKTVEIFIEEGVVGRIEGGHFGGRESHWTSPFVVSVPIVDGEEVRFERHPITEEPARSFYAQFLPALVDHLKARGWLGRYLQHLADEPIAENADSYIDLASYVREQAPELKIVEALHNRDLEGAVDVWVPQLNFMHEDYDFYAARSEAGEEAWFYTCLAPQGEYANRFIELPLLKTRILHWINYRYAIPGYLHWGLNFWRGDPFDETTGIIVESGNVLPGGDAWIVYPGYRTLLPSIRLEAMRDGIVDYELLKRLEQTHPEEAKELARQVVYRFDLYDMNIEAFRDKRRRILTLLSESAGSF